MTVGGVVFGPLVARLHAEGYLTTPTAFGSFPPVVETPYFLGVVLASTNGSPNDNRAKMAPQAPGLGVFVISSGQEQQPELKEHEPRRATRKWRAISHSGKTTRMGSLRVFLDGRAPHVPEERYTSSVPLGNRFAALAKIRQERGKGVAQTSTSQAAAPGEKIKLKPSRHN